MTSAIRQGEPGVVKACLLGQFEVRAGHEIVFDGSWPRSKARGLFKLLALAPGRRMRRDEVIGVLWPNLDTAASSNNFHKNLHYLRTMFAARGLTGLVSVSGETVALDPHVRVDVDMFVERARAASVARIDASLYDEALAVYAGDLLIDDLEVAWVDDLQRRLADTRARLLLELSHLHLIRRRYDTAIGVLRDLVTVDPTYEEAHGLLMRSYAAIGRPDRALAQFECCKEILREELDVAPSAEMEAMYRALRHGSSPGLNETSSHADTFVGRVPELDVLRTMLEEAFQGQGGVVLVSGHPGIGKSRLLDEFMVYAELRGARTSRGRCYEHDGAPAFWPWEQVLAAIPGDVERPTRRLDALRAPNAAADASGHVQRLRLFERIARAFESTSRTQPFVIALDDVHRADVPSLLLLQFLGRELRQARILIVAAYRSTEVGGSLATVRAELARDAHVQMLELAGLERHDVRCVIEYAGVGTGDEIEGLCERLYGRSEGNPLFLRELLRDLQANGGSGSRSLPRTLGDVIGVRLARVSGECHDLLSAASVIGRDVDLDVLASTVRWEPSRCLKALDEAVAEQLLYETSDTGRYRFSHTLFVEALYESASAGLRAEVHRRAGEAIERLRAGQIDRYVAELASHYARAALTDEDGKRAVDWTARAGRRDMELLAYEDAVDHYEQALALCDRFDCVSASRQCELLLALADAANRAGNLQQCNDAAARAAELAAQLGERELQSRATLLTGPRTPYGQDGTWLPEDIARLEAAIAAWGNEDSELHALLLARLGMSLSTRNYVADATAKARQALQMGERVTQAGVPQLLHYAHGALFVDGAIEERLAIARSLIAAARSLGDTEMEAHGHVWLYADLLASGEIADADRVNQELMRLAESMRQPFFAWYAFAQRSASATLHGRFDESERCAAQAAAAAKGSLPPGVAEITEQGVSRFALRLLRGDLEGLAEWYTPVADAFEAASGSLTVRCFPTLALAEVGRLDEAKQHVCRLMESAYLSRNDYMWLIGLGSLIETCALLDERRWAADMYEALLPYSSQCIILAEGGAWRGAVTHFLGVLSTMMGEWDDAERHFAHAIAVHERAEAPPFIARTQYEWAKMLVARNDGRGRARALKLLSCAGETARDLGMQPLARRVGDLAGTL